METQKYPIPLPDIQFVMLLEQARRPDGQQAMLKLLDYYEPEMRQLSRYMPMSQEDAMQSLRLELIELLHSEQL
ncbi:hypothetical protein [Paenibacillus campi]|uniref:hypothetical protein n=1 Tax=Paenibacillus campi TaxID=3106031 RepID=UPI002B0018BC|nr:MULTISPECIES: hypothetical protein [unclassified Paenibacillus]